MRYPWLILVGLTWGFLPLLSGERSERDRRRWTDQFRPDTTEVVVTGRVSDADGSGVGSARLLVTPAGEEERPGSGHEDAAVAPGKWSAATTDSSGYLTMAVAASTELEARIVAPQGGDWTFGLESPAGTDLHLEIVLPPDGRAGPWPVSVDLERRFPSLRESGFYRRRRTRDGYFVGPEEVREASRDRRFDRLLSTARGTARSATCPDPVVYLDGRRLADRPTGPEQRELLALEVYRRTDPAPDGFESPRDCGVVVLWTTSAEARQPEERRR